ncbi:putative membrane protein YeaQ/YmgE (transglycosylase-associated protein family) [Salana multivorans]|uniref:Putative membrane protein YeaQ/YmgE (Transglycosylase-associated protein family) n=1 Tax=Salana multivorans TaxID=120377 RepID=A0A3N2DBV1_9MICO|nr:GlsB/YeaQ/YmgE family stress response membrane protein [Salana multivorans]MBN8882191.1 GlsB/YeaQ/YmgE family stress response membrane protein [Salana multivorans]OJX95964.1 MAG: hypothetical protein BGO96_06555 [Micrococcales bacterium 73-15]ROR97207.1 putative membrane protein YeaQ/YmgE (transglycosylase-associated protein family) [Salana multivorans]
MGFISLLILGLIAGAIAGAILKDRAPGGFLATLVVGVIGAVLGGWIGSAISGEGLKGFFDLWSWILAIGGSLLVLLIYGAISGRKR